MTKKPQSPTTTGATGHSGHATDAPHSTPADSPSQAPREYLLSAGNDLRTPIKTCPSAATCEAWSQTYQSPVIVFNRCRRWGCPYCGPLKVRSLAARVAEAKPSTLITLTVDPKLHESPRVAYDKTTGQVSRLAAKIRKKWKPFEYIRILEITKKGWPHYHLVAQCPYIPQRTLSDEWAQLTGAPIVDVRKIRESWHVYTYVVKYLAKQTYIPWTDRRVSYTRNFFPQNDDWQPAPLDLVGHTFHTQHPLDYVSSHFPGYTLREITNDVWQLVHGPAYNDRFT